MASVTVSRPPDTGPLPGMRDPSRAAVPLSLAVLKACSRRREAPLSPPSGECTAKWRATCRAGVCLPPSVMLAASRAACAGAQVAFRSAMHLSACMAGGCAGAGERWLVALGSCKIEGLGLSFWDVVRCQRTA